MNTSTLETQTPDTNPITVQIGLPAAQRQRAARLYYQAFRQKLQPIFRDEAKGIAVLEQALDPAHALVALQGGDLVGIAGFKDQHGSLVDLKPHQMTQAFGWIGGWLRLLPLAIFVRPLEPGILLMDGIVVDATRRGGGVGTRLLDAVLAYARTGGYQAVRLDVVDTNPRARALYERRGFVPVSTVGFPLLQPLFGFARATTMHYQLDEDRAAAAG